MGSFLISKIDGVRLAANPRSEEAHDVLEFRGLVRGWQPEERQEWIPPLLACGNHRQDGTDQGLLERLWKDREVRPLLLPTRWWPRAVSRTTLVPKVGEEMLGFSEEAQGWLPCKITTVMDDKWQIEWWDGSQADKIKDKTELHHFEEAGWWYRITEKVLARKCHHCQNTDGSQGQWRTQDEWESSRWCLLHTCM
jgi:hypothetical protein